MSDLLTALSSPIGVMLGLALVAMLVAVVGLWGTRQHALETERRLHHDQQLLAATLAGTGAGLVLTDAAGRVTQLNAAAERMTGWTEAEARGKAAAEVLVVEQAVAQAVPGEAGAPPQHTLVRSRSGPATAVGLSRTALIGSDGRAQGEVTVLRDLSRRFDVELQSRSAEARFRLVVEAAPAGLIMADVHGLITLANRRAEEMFGYGADELLGCPVAQLVPMPMREGHEGKMQGLFHTPTTRALGAGRDLRGLRRDGSEFPVEIGLSPLQAPEGSFVLASVIDISERQQRDDELRRSNADLEQFAYIASHDLQEPLRMVASYTELLAQRYQGQLDERADKYIFFAVDGAKRMQRLVADLLAFARVGSQGKPLVAVDMAAVLQHVLFMLQAPIAAANATVTVGPLPRVLADEDQLHQLLQNLVGNALKFRGEAAPRVHISATAEQDRWKVAVQDNGIGIEPRYADRIFQMFQRLHERGRYEGSGIGLAIAKRILERHGGSIWFESTPGQGTTFYFTLHAAPAGPAA